MKARIVLIVLAVSAAGALACDGLDAPKPPPRTGTTIHPTGHRFPSTCRC